MPADLDSRLLARALAWAVLVGTTGILALWVVPDPGLDRVLTSTMKANTSVCLAALAASLLLGMRGARSWARWLAIAAAGIAGATLLQYAVGVDFGIDQLVVHDAADAEGAHPAV